jgi:hypothetical protein
MTPVATNNAAVHGEQGSSQSKAANPQDPDGALRADHVQLFYTYMPVLLSLNMAENGWLVLHRSGEVSFIESKQLNLDARPKFTAASPSALAATPKHPKARKVRFGDKTRYLTFDGLIKPPGSASGAEATTGGAMALAGVAVAPLVQGLGILTDLKSYTVDNRGSSERAQKARGAWLPVMDGTAPWEDIETNMPPVIS